MIALYYKGVLLLRLIRWLYSCSLYSLLSLITLILIGREKAILEMDLKLDDLLEKQQLGVVILDLEYVKLSVAKTRALLNKHFLKK